MEQRKSASWRGWDAPGRLMLDADGAAEGNRFGRVVAIRFGSKFRWMGYFYFYFYFYFNRGSRFRGTMGAF